MNTKRRVLCIRYNRGAKQELNIPYARGWHQGEFMARRDKEWFVSYEAMMRHVED